MHIIAPYISCVINAPLKKDDPSELQAALDAGYVEIYVISAEGILKHHKLIGENRYIRVKVDSIPGYTQNTVPQAIQFLPAGKIPKILFDQILGFFYEVIKKNGEQALEAMTHILWNREKGYHIGIPPQKISAAAVTYDWSYIPSGTILVADIHSHNYMGAFFSSTDDRDDVGNVCFSGVVGKLNEPTPMTVWRFNYMQRKFEAKFEDVFDVAQEKTEVPKEWLDQVKVGSGRPRIGTQLGFLPGESGYSRSTGSGYDYQPPSARGKKGKAEHLKKYQFQKKGDYEDEFLRTSPQGSMREGPGLRTAPWSRGSAIEDGFTAGGNSKFWKEGRGAGLVDNTPAGSDPSDDPWLGVGSAYAAPHGGVSLGKLKSEVEKSSTVDTGAGTTSLEDEIDPVGSASNNADTGTSGLTYDVSFHPQYDTIAITNGTTAADAYCMIDTVMSDLSGQDSLLGDAILDMFELASEDSKLSLFKKVYDRLSREDQENLASRGL